MYRAVFSFIDLSWCVNQKKGEHIMSTIISFCNWLQIFILGNQKQKPIKKKSIPEPRYSYIGFEGKVPTIPHYQDFRDFVNKKNKISYGLLMLSIESISGYTNTKRETKDHYLTISDGTDKKVPPSYWKRRANAKKIKGGLLFYQFRHKARNVWSVKTSQQWGKYSEGVYFDVRWYPDGFRMIKHTLDIWYA